MKKLPPDRRGPYARSAALRDLAVLHRDEYEALYRKYHEALGGTPRREAACGTNSGYKRHSREGTQPCVECRDAAAQYQRDWRRRVRV